MGRLRTANARRQRAAGRSRAAGAGLAWLHDAALLRPDLGGRRGRARNAIEIVASARIPGGGGVLQLARSGRDFSIQFEADELMGSTDHVSEEALATLACARLAGEGGSVLVGGLGMGFTLRAVLACRPAASRVVVAELVPEVVAWAEGPLAHLFGDSLDDPRVSIELADVHDVIARADAAFDAILLDVDNGPDGFMRPENDRLYCNWGLRAAHAALRPGGVLAIWSAYPDAAFGDRLAGVGFAVEEVTVPAYAGSTDRHHSLWFAKRAGVRVERGSLEAA